MAEAGADTVVTFVVANAWRGVGIGHSIFASAQWLTLGSMLPARVRFAFCVPAGAPARYLRIGRRQYPNCSAPDTFDLHEHLTREGDELRASADEFRRVGRLLQSPSCQQLVDASRTETGSVVLVYDSLPRNMLAGCLQELGNTTSATFDGQLVVVPELRKLQLSPPRRLLPCGVGLHVRTMAVDQPGCNAFLAPESCSHELRRHAACSLSQLLEPSGFCSKGPRFVTSDDPSMYARLGRAWRSNGEHAVNPSLDQERARAGETFGALAKRTVVAWLTLASCRHAIVAPIGSAFSQLAHLRAGRAVHFAQCCPRPLSNRGVPGAVKPAVAFRRVNGSTSVLKMG
tara:strand:+ start:2945 stop:3976 length:1032 start_codon:yes stop_codon:yes gene_type:complete